MDFRVRASRSYATSLRSPRRRTLAKRRETGEEDHRGCVELAARLTLDPPKSFAPSAGPARRHGDPLPTHVADGGRPSRTAYFRRDMARSQGHEEVPLVAVCEHGASAHVESFEPFQDASGDVLGYLDDIEETSCLQLGRPGAAPRLSQERGALLLWLGEHRRSGRTPLCGNDAADLFRAPAEHIFRSEAGRGHWPHSAGTAQREVSAASGTPCNRGAQAWQAAGPVATGVAIGWSLVRARSADVAG
jgi:hypothetical protein